MASRVPAVPHGKLQASSMRQEHAMTTQRAFRVGDHMRWNSEAGVVGGHIVKVHVADFDYKGHTHHASADRPQYEIRSDRTDHVAAHYGEALTKID